MFKDSLKRQENLQNLIGNPMNYGETAIKENILALIVELTEVLNEINWKNWKASNKVVDKDLLHAEIADCYLFLFNITNASELSHEKLKNLIFSKQNSTLNRFNNKY
jgi:dimeric dUTPase (all-alpha-NTP-PPase superfamily)